MDKDLFIEELKKIGINISEKQLGQLDKYYHLLVEWNEKINLTRITEEKQVYLKHFYDSLSLINIVDLNRKISLCDIGTGAGFPGLVLKIVFPSLSITLVDSLQKRIDFLNKVIDELNLVDIKAIHIRAEDLARNNNEKYDIVTCRAVSRLNKLLKYCMPLLKESGSFIPMKANCEDEIKEISQRKVKIVKIVKFVLPVEESNRTLLEIKNK